jgi:hypothetical protein
MIDPSLWASVPFNNPTAWEDFTGTLELWHRALSQAIFAKTGKTIGVRPIGNGGGGEWLSAVQAQYRDAAAALGLPAPPDLQSYDLKQATDFASWTWVVSQQSRTLRVQAGLS